jgi:hypothetical protein
MKSCPAELARYRAEEIDPRTNAPWKKGKHMNHTLEPAPPWEQLGISEEEFDQRQAKVTALAAPQTNAPPEVPDATDEFLAQAAARHPELAPPEPPTRKPRSDKGVQRGPKAPGEPEAAATVETTALTVELTAVQYVDLEREAARVYRDIEPRYLTEAPATVLLNSRVQKHWRTLVGKVTA